MPAQRKRGMGRGLAAILPESAAGGPELRELPVDLIEPNPEQPRSSFEPAALDALAGSISSAGLLQPLIVRPLDGGRFELVAGERRWRAAQKAGLDRVPAVIRTSPEDERLQAALIENMVREDLNPVDEARACAALVDDLGISKEELARLVGRSRAAISNLIRLLDLPDQVLKLLAKGDLTEGHGRVILQVGRSGCPHQAREARGEGGLVGSRHRAAHARRRRQEEAPLDQGRADQLGGAGRDGRGRGRPRHRARPRRPGPARRRRGEGRAPLRGHRRARVARPSPSQTKLESRVPGD